MEASNGKIDLGSGVKSDSIENECNLETLFDEKNIKDCKMIEYIDQI
jgi:hypothetical protein